MKQIFIYAIVLLVLSSYGFSDLIAYEDFNYGRGANVHAKRGGYGFRHGWVVQRYGCDNINDQIVPLQVEQMAQPVNFSRIRCGKFTRTYFVSDSLGVKQTLYYGFFFRVEEISSSSEDNSGDIYFLKLLANDEQTVTASVQSTPQRGFKISFGEQTAEINYGFEYGKTYYLVAKFTLMPRGYKSEMDLIVLDRWNSRMREPGRWLGSLKSDGCTGIFKYSYGSSYQDKELYIGHIRVGTRWNSILPSSRAKELLEDDGYVFKTLMHGDDIINPLNRGFSRVSMLPSASSDVMDILITTDTTYIANNMAIHSAEGVKPEDIPEYSSPNLPLYGKAQPLEHLNKSGLFRAVNREDGLYDIIDTVHMEYYRNIGDKNNPVFEEPVSIKTRHSVSGNKTIGDIDGDGVVDLLISQPILHHHAQYWPGDNNPWWILNEPDLGSSKDYENVGPARGRDIAGNWLGSAVTSKFYWAKGYWDDGVISFEPRKPIYLGKEDYQAQWRSWNSWGAWIGTMHINDKVYVIAFGDIDSIVAMPVIKTGKNVHLGRAVNLLKDGKNLGNTHLCQITFIGDINGDGYTEVVLSAGADGMITVLKGKKVGEFENMGRICTLGGPVTANTLVTPCRKDFNDNGFKDLIVGCASGHIWFMPGTENPTVYGQPIQFKADGKIIHRIPGEHKSLQGPQEAMWGYIQPTVGDWTGDGKLEIITNDSSAELMLFVQTEDVFNLKQYPITMNGSAVPAAWRVRPAIIPAEKGVAGDDRATLLYLDGDGDLAVLVPEEKGSHKMERSFKLKNTEGMTMRLCGPHDGLWGRTKFAVVDWDGDGVWDIIFGAQGTISRHFTAEPSEFSSSYWMRNVGTNDKPVFEDPKIIRKSNGRKFQAGKHNFSVYPTDINNDGRIDLIAGEELGHIIYMYRNELRW